MLVHLALVVVVMVHDFASEAFKLASLEQGRKYETAKEKSLRQEFA
jgi:hypothetical protein